MTTYERAFEDHARGHLYLAERGYRDALRENPRHAGAHSNLGVVCFQQHRFDEAVIHYQDALCLDPSAAIVYSNMSAALVAMNRPVDALPFSAVSAERDPANIPALSNLADVLLRLNRHADVIEVLEHLLTLDPAFPKALTNLGIAHVSLNNIDAARSLFQQALTTDRPQPPRDAALAQANIAKLELARGDFSPATWEHYEARFQADGLARRYTKHVPWDGKPWPLATLIVVAEQGLGDEILYLSMLPDLRRAFQGRIIWEADRRLHSIVPAQIRGNATFETRTLANTDRHPEATCRIDAGSLGRYLRTERDDFPKRPWLHAARHMIPAGPRIGLSWRSVTPAHGRAKTIPLSEWSEALDVLRTRGARTVNLQYGETPELDAYPFVFRPNRDFRYEIAALAREIASCTHVFTASNTTAHLAGALGVPTTVFVPDGMARYWYWGFGDTTPWYPSIRIVRQNGRPWSDVLKDAALDITRQSP